MGNVIFAVLLLLGGALQLWAAVSASRRQGPLRSMQGRQLDAMLGRRGTVAFFGFFGVSLTLSGLWLLVVNLLAMR